MNGMTLGLLALVAGLMLACGGVVDAPPQETARQEQALCSVCGDSFCDASTENAFNCPQDCAGSLACCDHRCCDGESPSSCPYASDPCYVTPRF